MRSLWPLKDGSLELPNLPVPPPLKRAPGVPSLPGLEAAMAPGDRDLVNVADFFDPEVGAPFGEFWLMFEVVFTFFLRPLCSRTWRQDKEHRYCQEEHRHANPRRAPQNVEQNILCIKICRVALPCQTVRSP